MSMEVTTTQTRRVQYFVIVSESKLGLVQHIGERTFSKVRAHEKERAGEVRSLG